MWFIVDPPNHVRDGETNQIAMKRIPLLIGLLAATLSPIPSACAQTKAEPATSTEAASDLALLSAVGSLADAYLLQTQHTLEILARTAEAQSGQWERMEPLIKASVPSTPQQVLWFTLPDGTYYTSAEGRVDQKLSDRAYFPGLIAGKAVCGDLVVSKSTGKKSVIIAVPVKSGGRVVGGLGASIFVDDLSQLLKERLKLPDWSLFYALTKDGVTAYHIDPKLDFEDPRKLQSSAMDDAVKTMLSQAAGEVTYEFNGAPRRVYFNTSALTGWRVAFGRVLLKVPE
jgi:hypothetical protein